jgi:hypothetical protein
MSTLAHRVDGRVEAVYFTRNSLVVDLMDGRTISAPLDWYPRLLKASPQERAHWKICGGGYGIHWPKIDEDLSIEGLLRGAPAPIAKPTKKPIKRKSIRLIKQAKLKFKSKKQLQRPVKK